MRTNIKKAMLTAAVLMSLYLCSGCYSGQEPNEIAYVVGLGIDKGTEMEYNITIQFAKPTQISGGASQEGGKGGDIIENITVEAPTIYSAIDIANQVISKDFSLSHTKIIVFSEEVAKEGIEPVLETLIRNEEIRPDAYIVVSVVGAKNYLNEVNPVIEVNPAIYYQLLFEGNKNSSIVKSIAETFYFSKDGSLSNNVLPLTGVIKSEDKSSDSGNSGSSEGGQGGSEEGSGQESGSGSQQTPSPESGDTMTDPIIQNNIPQNTDAFEYKMKSYKAGEVSISEANKGEVSGMGIFKNNKLIAYAGSTECKLYNLLKGEFENGYLSFYSEENGETPVTVHVQQTKKPKIEVDISQDVPKVKCSLYLQGSIGNLNDKYHNEENIDKLKQNIEISIKDAVNDFLYKTSREYDSDIVGIGEKVRYKFLTYWDLQDYNWEEQYSKCEFETEVEFKF